MINTYLFVASLTRYPHNRLDRERDLLKSMVNFEKEHLKTPLNEIRMVVKMISVSSSTLIHWTWKETVAMTTHFHQVDYFHSNNTYVIKKVSLDVTEYYS